MFEKKMCLNKRQLKQKNYQLHSYRKNNLKLMTLKT